MCPLDVGDLERPRGLRAEHDRRERRVGAIKNCPVASSPADDRQAAPDRSRRRRSRRSAPRARTAFGARSRSAPGRRRSRARTAAMWSIVPSAVFGSTSLAAEERLPRRDRQQVGAEPVDRREQVGLARGRHADDRDHRADPDRDPKRRERRRRRRVRSPWTATDSSSRGAIRAPEPPPRSVDRRRREPQLRLALGRLTAARLRRSRRRASGSARGNVRRSARRG